MACSLPVALIKRANFATEKRSQHDYLQAHNRNQIEKKNRMSPTTLRLLGAEVYAHHGVQDAERELGGRYSFDIEYSLDAETASQIDELDSTVNYVSVYEAARDVVVGTQRRLLEAIVSEIATNLISEFQQIEEVTVRLRKLHPPITGIIGVVEVEKSLSRSEG